MRTLGNGKRIKFYHRFIGQTLPVLIETKRDRSTGLLKGISSNYLPVLVDGGNDLKNKIIDVEIQKAAHKTWRELGCPLKILLRRKNCDGRKRDYMYTSR